jgi:post-segregation antitoxin (ccd killing protein)
MSVAVLVRFREDVDKEMRSRAQALGISLSQFAAEAVEARLEAIKAEEWRKGIEAMANDPEAIDWEWIEFGMSQAEAILAEYEK